jgi:hypothetical protein
VAAAKLLLQEAWAAGRGAALAAERRWQRRLVGRPNQRTAMERNLKKAQSEADGPAFAPRRIG